MSEHQTSVSYDRFLKYLINAAKPYIPNAGAMGVSANRFFSIAAGQLATQTLKSVGIYDSVVKAFGGGPFTEYDIPEEGGVVNGETPSETDPLLEDVEEDEVLPEEG